MHRFLLICFILVGVIWSGLETQESAAPPPQRAPDSASPARARQPAQPFPRVIAWMPSSWDADAALRSFQAHPSQIDEISPFWYGMTASGALAPRTGAPNADLVAAAHEAGILVLPTISNSFDPARVHTVLNNDTIRSQHVQAIVFEVISQNYDGIDIDYENLLASDRELFSQFLAELAVALQQYNRLLSVAVQAKTGDAFDWDGVGAHDYAAIAGVADEVRIMTYGWCWRTGCVGSSPPGPIAPVFWIRDVMSYARGRIPPSRLIMGIPLYGYDWWPVDDPDSPLNGRALNWQQVQDLRQQYEPQVQWWESEARGAVQEHWFRYGNGHQVVYADRDSVGVRWQVAQEYQAAGVALWYLGSDDPAIWDFLGRRSFSTPTPPPPSPTPEPSPTATTTPTPTLSPKPSPSPSPTLFPTLYLPLTMLKYR